jgi:hypothetical protein
MRSQAELNVSETRQPGATVRALRRHHLVEPRQVLLQDLPIEEYQGAQRLVLPRRRLSLPFNPEGYTYSGSAFRAVDPVVSDSISGAGGPPWCGRSWPWSSGESSLGSCGATSTPRTWKSWSFATNFRCSVGTSAGPGFVGATGSSSPRRGTTRRKRSSEGRARGCGEVAGAAAICRDLPPAVAHPAEHSD